MTTVTRSGPWGRGGAPKLPLKDSDGAGEKGALRLWLIRACAALLLEPQTDRLGVRFVAACRESTG